MADYFEEDAVIGLIIGEPLYAGCFYVCSSDNCTAGRSKVCKVRVRSLRSYLVGAPVITFCVELDWASIAREANDHTKVGR